MLHELLQHHHNDSHPIVPQWSHTKISNLQWTSKSLACYLGHTKSSFILNFVELQALQTPCVFYQVPTHSNTHFKYNMQDQIKTICTNIKPNVELNHLSHDCTNTITFLYGLNSLLLTFVGNSIDCLVN